MCPRTRRTKKSSNGNSARSTSCERGSPATSPHTIQQNIVIHRLRCELAVTGRERARIESDRFAALFYDRFQQTLYKLFDRLPAHRSIRCDQLEIDLGVVSAGWTETELADRITRELVRAVLHSVPETVREEIPSSVHGKTASIGQPTSGKPVAEPSDSDRRSTPQVSAEPGASEPTIEHVWPPPRKPAAGVREVDPETSDTDMLIHFLRFGVAPWYAAETKFAQAKRTCPGTPRNQARLRSAIVDALAEDFRRIRRLIHQVAVSVGWSLLPATLRSRLSSEFPVPAQAWQVISLLMAALERREELARLWATGAGSLQADPPERSVLLRLAAVLHPSAGSHIPAELTSLHRWIEDASETPEESSSTELRQHDVKSSLSSHSGSHATDREAIGSPRSDLSAYRDGLTTPFAGLVLLHPFLEIFFTGLGWWNKHAGDYASEKARWSAVHILPFLSTGRFCADEHLLVLPRILCGIPVSEPAEFPEIEKDAIEESEYLLQTVIERWPALKNTSIPGLREAFLHRPGLLRPEPETGWRLHVEQRPYDLLLSRLPWSYDRIRFKLMPEPLWVTWPIPR